MVQMMALKERTVTELAKPFDMSLAANSKHIKVLERANLVDCRSNSESLSQANEWLSFYEKFWSNRFNLLENVLVKAKRKEH
jgi:DNA-binding transcriptional ArsR family regulator